MIRFSTRSEYGLRMMMDLARHYGQGPLSLSEVARHEAMSATYLEQLAGKLRRGGLVTSRHGAHGGYELSRPPVEISVGEVLRVLEGPISPMICATEGESEIACDRQFFCSVNLVWERVRDTVAQALDSMTLAELVPMRNVRANLTSAGQSLTPAGRPADVLHFQVINEPTKSGRNVPAV